MMDNDASHLIAFDFGWSHKNGMFGGCASEAITHEHAFFQFYFVRYCAYILGV